MRRAGMMLLAAVLALSLAACGAQTDGEAESTSAPAAESTMSEESASGGTEDDEIYEEALECYEMLTDTEEDARYEAFTQAQSSLNYDENNERYYVDPDTAANLPEGLNETALSLGDYEIGLSDRTPFGWFIVMRLPLSDEELTQVKEDYASALYEEQLDGAADSALTEETGALDEVDFTAYLEALGELQTQITDSYAELSETYGDAQELEEALLEALPVAAREDCVAYLTGGALSRDTAVMTVDGTDVAAETLFYFLNYEKNMQLGTGSVSDTYLATLLNLAKKDVIRYTAAGNQAEENGVALTQEERDSIREVLDNTLESTMLYLGCNTGALEAILYDTSLGNAYASSLYGESGTVAIPDADVEAYAAENDYYSCLYIWFYEIED